MHYIVTFLNLQLLKVAHTSSFKFTVHMNIIFKTGINVFVYKAHEDPLFDPLLHKLHKDIHFKLLNRQVVPGTVFLCGRFP